MRELRDTGGLGDLRAGVGRLSVEKLANILQYLDDVEARVRAQQTETGPKDPTSRSPAAKNTSPSVPNLPFNL